MKKRSENFGGIYKIFDKRTIDFDKRQATRKSMLLINRIKFDV